MQTFSTLSFPFGLPNYIDNQTAACARLFLSSVFCPCGNGRVLRKENSPGDRLRKLLDPVSYSI